ncbi:MAG: hypothetical protein AVDCRST_MAG69-2661 [uncultured Solirubrobacteraceae bacterium]|uniref:Uncharacterized protein n=1 Tax=uncultured Solirubrobacteraceae bacterium TaxID=1162706 RepID=A0A6J4T515_9ACTN|nr:MAG: hypothetical protein AVDCRST_MAG69-2661 [uncultured Solirubrobacteraceae bacterium]
MVGSRAGNALRVKRTALDRLWNPPGRTPAQVRNSRVRIVGSLILLTGLLIGVVLLLLR